MMAFCGFILAVALHRVIAGELPFRSRKPEEPSVELAVLRAKFEALNDAVKAFDRGFFKHEALSIIIARSHELEMEYETKKIALARSQMEARS